LVYEKDHYNLVGQKLPDGTTKKIFKIGELQKVTPVVLQFGHELKLELSRIKLTCSECGFPLVSDADAEEHMKMTGHKNVNVVEKEKKKEVEQPKFFGRGKLL